MNITVPTRPCPMCGESHTVEVPKKAYEEWRRTGRHIQNALPMLSADDREMLISGTDPACWNRLFPNQD